MTASQNIAQATDLEGRAITTINTALDYWWVGLLLVIGLWLLWSLRNQHKLLAEVDERADAAFGDIDAMLAERQALITNLSATVKAFAKMEKDVVTEVLLSRVDALEALDGGSVMGANNQMAGMLQNVFSVADNYPTLASDNHFRELRVDLVRIEEKLTASRKFYNLAVEESNALRRTFPASLFAKPMGVEKRDKFSVGERREILSEPIAVDL